MAWTDVTYKCGDVVREQVYGSSAERERYLWVAANKKECPTHYQAAQEAQRTELAGDAALAARARQLPALTGTEKQIQWAERIRYKFVESLDKLKDDLLKTKSDPVSLALYTDAVGFAEELAQQEASKEWIENLQNITAKEAATYFFAKVAKVPEVLSGKLKLKAASAINPAMALRAAKQVYQTNAEIAARAAEEKRKKPVKKLVLKKLAPGEKRPTATPKEHGERPPKAPKKPAKKLQLKPLASGQKRPSVKPLSHGIEKSKQKSKDYLQPDYWSAEKLEEYAEAVIVMDSASSRADVPEEKLPYYQAKIDKMNEFVALHGMGEVSRLQDEADRAIEARRRPAPKKQPTRAKAGPHGGARPGAGRPKGEETKVVSVRISVDVIERIEEGARAEGLSLGGYLAQYINLRWGPDE